MRNSYVFLEAVNGDIKSKNINTANAINGGGNITISATNNIIVTGKIDVSGGKFGFDSFGNLLILSERVTNAGKIILQAKNQVELNTLTDILSVGTLGG